MNKRRCFISIEFDDNLKEQISKIQDKLPEFIGKKTEIKNIHLTLKFLGEIEEEKINLVKEKLKEVKLKSFFAEIDFLGVFSEKFVKIIWLNINNCDALQKQIDEKLKNIFEKEQRFQGHITIARVKKIKDKKKFLEEFKKINFEKIQFKVDKFHLKESVLTKKGPEYKNIGIFYLD